MGLSKEKSSWLISTESPVPAGWGCVFCTAAGLASMPCPHNSWEPLQELDQCPARQEDQSSLCAHGSRSTPLAVLPWAGQCPRDTWLGSWGSREHLQRFCLDPQQELPRHFPSPKTEQLIGILWPCFVPLPFLIISVECSMSKENDGSYWSSVLCPIPRSGALALLESLRCCVPGRAACINMLMSSQLGIPHF